MDPQELVPLEAGIARPPRQHQNRQCTLAARSCYRAPLRLCRLLALLIVLPSLFIMIPLYMRYRVFLGQMYPMSMTDMRLIDSKISPTWCQRQVVRSNATFNAFVVPGPPQLSLELVPVSMTRELELEDDMKEYWGFYLLKGSSVTVSACVSYPGASLIMIKGYKHLQECAYIGDDSSEEVDELVEAYSLGLMSNTTFMEKIQAVRLRKVDGKANDPDQMRRHKAGVSFLDPKTVTNLTSSEDFPTNTDITDHDPKELKEILEKLHALRQAAKTESLKYYRPPDHLISVPALHRHRDANVDKDERRFLSFKDIDGNNSETIGIIKDANTQRQNLTANIPQKDNINNTHTNYTNTESNIKVADKDILESTTKLFNTQDNNDLDENDKEVISNAKNNNTIFNKNKKQQSENNSDEVQTRKDVKTDILDKENTKVYNENVDNLINKVEDTEIENMEHKNIENGQNSSSVQLKIVDAEFTTVPTPEPDSPELNSKEVFEDVLHRLQALGDRGKRVLVRLHETMGVRYRDKSPAESDIMSSVTGSEEELDRLRRVLVEAIDEEKTKTQREQRRRESMQAARAKRELMLGQIDLIKELNQDDEARDYAAEEGLEPDGYAEHHSTVNETTPLDMSNSEFWSSFSSSEEALLECEGLILNLPLTPHSGCREGASEEEAFKAARANALTYRVPANGYYFFVFNSENEVQKNYIRAKFDLQKTRYDIARTKLRECTNSTNSCHLPLDIFTSQKGEKQDPVPHWVVEFKTRGGTATGMGKLDVYHQVVLEVPLRDNDSLWNEQFVIISECEPRTSIYLFCVIAVPILIVVFAFQ